MPQPGFFDLGDRYAKLDGIGGPLVTIRADNVFIERRWKTVTYQEVYLHAYTSVSEAKVALARYFAFGGVRNSVCEAGFTLRFQ